MGLKQRLAQQLRTQPDRTTQPRFGAASPFGGTASDGAAIVEFTPNVVNTIRLGTQSAAYDMLYRTQPAVRTCVSFLALGMAPLNIKTWRGAEGSQPVPVSAHPLVNLLQQPNPYCTRFELTRDTVSDLAIYADAYWLLEERGNARQMFRLPPSYVEPKGGNVLSGPSAYVLNNPETGVRIPLDPADVIHFSGYNPTDSRIGTSPLEALHHVLNEDVQASIHREHFWKNHAGRDGVIERPPAEVSGQWDDTARTRFRADWNARNAGNESAGGTPVLEDGMKWNPDSFSPKDSEFIAGREFTLDTVATAYHIPLAVLSRKATATFASMKEFRKLLYVDTLGPWMSLIEGAIGLQLIPRLPDSEGLFVRFNIDEKLEGDFEQQAEAARQSVQVPWMSVDEMRAKRGLAPLGGDYGEPARPGNYLYGDDEPLQGQEQDTTEGTELTVAASNGHHDEPGLVIGTLEES